MLTTEQIILLAFLSLWIFTGILLYIFVNKYLDEEFKHFYPHPIINIIKDIKANNHIYSKFENIFICCASFIVYIPLTCEWFIIWCIYKLLKFLCAEDVQEQEITEMAKINNITDKEYELKIEKHSREMEEALNNPEAIPKNVTEDICNSRIFLEYIRSNKHEEENN